MPIRPVGPAQNVGRPSGNFGTASGPGMRLGQLPAYKKGGTVKKTGPALVHKGEKIIPAKKAKKK